MQQPITPETILSTNDPGDDMQRRLRYQATYAASLALSLLADDSEFDCLFCEHHEDILVKRKDGKFIGVQVKTQASNEPFKANDEPVINTLNRFIELESQFSESFSSYLLATNCGFGRKNKSRNNLPYLLDVAQSSDYYNALDSLNTQLDSFIKKLSETATYQKELVIKVLKKTSLAKNLPNLDEAKRSLIDELSQLPITRGADYEKLKKAAGLLAFRMFGAASLEFSFSQPLYFSLLKNSEEQTVRTIIEGKRITSEIVIKTIQEAIEYTPLQENYHTTISIPNNIPRSGIVEFVGRLEKLFLAPPRPTYNLVGHDEVFSNLKQQLFTAKSVALNGLPGVGKTALAVELAHAPEVLEQFPDGVLWAGLGRQPDVTMHLSTWAVALGIPQAEVAKLTSVGVEAWAKAIHAAIGMRRMLLVVDDAWQTEAALAFKLGGPNCAHLVTTRLPRIALDFAGEYAIAVKELSEDQGLTLLTQLASRVVEAEPEEAKALVKAVGGLPLGLILMGKYLRQETHSGQPRRLHRALERLRKTEERLRLTQSQSPLERQPSLPVDTPLSLLAVIEISDEALDEVSSYALRALSVFPPKPNTFSEEAALAVCTAPVETLDKLVDDSGLLESSEPGRYTLHQTIADYARLKLTDETAYERMVVFFIGYVKTNIEDYSALDLEINNILDALQVAFDRGMQVALVRGANMLSRFLETKGMYALAELHLNRAQKAARSLDDADALMTALGNLGLLATHLGDYTQAVNSYQEALVLAHKLGNQEVIRITLVNLGLVATYLGAYEQAEAILQDGLTLAEEIRDSLVSCSLLTNLGTVSSKQGKHPQAKEYYQRALILARHLKDQERISTNLEGLGVLAEQQGDDLQAEAYFQESLTIARKRGHSERIISLLMNLSAVTGNQENYTQMQKYLQEGLELARKTEHRLYTSAILFNWGWLHLQQQNIDSASTAFRESLETAQKAGIPEQMASAMYGLAKVAAAKCNPFEMDYWGQKSLAIFKSIGHHRAIEVKLWLDIHNITLLCQLGELYIKQQELNMAFETFFNALNVAKEAGISKLVAEALYGLARVTVTRGNTVEARRQGQESLTIFEANGDIKAVEVRQWLAGFP